MISGNATSNSAKIISPGGKNGKRRIMKGMLVSALVAALFVGTLALTVGGCTNTTASGARIQFDRNVIDLGTASPGDELEAVFVFRNDGNETLIIEEIATKTVTEGCWPPKPIVRDTTVEPGQESAITIFYTVKKVEGEQIFKYSVKSNDPSEPKKDLILKLVCVFDE